MGENEQMSAEEKGRLVVEAITGDLTVNPIQHIEQRTGRAALTLLIFSLAASPCAASTSQTART